MDRWVGKVAIVTGASAGIGHAIATTFANQGMKVVAVARRHDRLKDLAAAVKGSGVIFPFAGDVTKEEDVKKMVQEALREFGACHVLINNAGTAVNTKVLDGDMDQWKRMFDLNVFALGVATREVITSMHANDIGDGHIINISSISAHHPPAGVGKHVYNATKHAVRIITEGMRAELNELHSKIKISMISPGVVATEIFDVGGWQESYDHLPALDSQDIADAVVNILSAPPKVLIADYIVRPIGETIPA